MVLDVWCKFGAGANTLSKVIRRESLGERGNSLANVYPNIQEYCVKAPMKRLLISWLTPSTVVGLAH